MPTRPNPTSASLAEATSLPDPLWLPGLPQNGPSLATRTRAVAS